MNGLGILVLILVVAICVSAVVRLVAALFSERTRASLGRHPIAYSMWFGGGIAGLISLWIVIMPRYGSFQPPLTIISLKTDFSNIRSALDAYADDCGHYPTTDEGLKALMYPPTSLTNGQWHGPYIRNLTQDPWKHDYVYRCPGLYNTNDVDLYSCGFDGVSKSGGDDLDDINNWSLSPPGGNDRYLNKFEQVKDSPLVLLSLLAVPFLNGVRLIIALFSKRVQASIARHPRAHSFWLALSVLSVGLFVFFCVPRLSGR